MLERVKEIRLCLNAKCYHAALSLALTLPDICGEIKYPGECSSKRYVKWFDEYVYSEYYIHANACESYRKYFDFTGSVCYRLRCRYLHNNDLSIFNPDKNCHIDKFNLCVCTVHGKSIDSIQIEYNLDYMPEPYEPLPPENYEKLCAEVTLDIDVVRFCNVMCKAVERFCNEHNNKIDLDLHEITFIKTDTKHFLIPKEHN